MAAQPPQQAQHYTSASLYVGDLAPEVTEPILHEFFSSVGPLASVRVCRDAITRRSLGYGYVNFHSVVDAERALDTMNFTNIAAKPCRIMWSQRDPSLRKSGLGNIFVKNLDESIDNKTLFDTFSMFGNILSCKVATDAEKEKSLGYGFVHYETEEAANKAVESVNDMNIAGKRVQVTHWKPRNERGGDQRTFTNVYVKNLPEDITQEEFEELFSTYGEVTSCLLSVDEDGKAKGFGFINFENPEDAGRAVDEKNDFEFKGKILFAGPAQKKSDRQKQLKQQYEQVRLEQQKKYQGVNLYIKNISETVDDDALREMFNPFGTITSAKIMRDPNESSKGFGFVCFSSPEEATKAITEMNGKMIESKPLFVALAVRKETRRMQLEAHAASQRASKMVAGMPGGMPGAMPGGMQGMAGGIPGMPGQPQMYPNGVGVPPMFYPPSMHQGIPRPGGYIYPQAMNVGPRRGAWSNPQMMSGMPGGGAVAYMPTAAMQPMNGRVPRQGGGRGGQRPAGPTQMGATPAGPGAKNMGQMNRNRPQQQQNFKYMANVRNPQLAGQQPHAAAAMLQQQQQSQQMGGGQIPQQAPPPQQLTSTLLAQAPPKHQKQMIGEQLFPLVQTRQPELAGKITGMLLEMDMTELLHLLESPEALGEKISEAILVLREHESQMAAAAQQTQDQPPTNSANDSHTNPAPMPDSSPGGSQQPQQQEKTNTTTAATATAIADTPPAPGPTEQ